MFDTPLVPSAPAVPPAATVVPPPPPPTVPEAARPDPYAQPGVAQAAYVQPAAPQDTPSYSPYYGYRVRTNPLAIVSFGLPLVAVFIWFFGSVAAVICGHIALNQIKRTGEGGRGLALAGVIVGYVGIGLPLLIGIAYAIIIAGAVSSNSYGN